MKSNIERLKEVLGEGGRYNFTLGPEGERLTEEQIAGMVLDSIDRLVSGEYEDVVNVGGDKE